MKCRSAFQSPLGLQALAQVYVTLRLSARKTCVRAQVLLSELFTPGELRCEALVGPALQCFCAAASPAAAGAAAVLLRRLAPSPRALRPLEAHLAGGGGASLSGPDVEALQAFVGNLVVEGMQEQTALLPWIL